jgi:sporulation protein YlmC with PRC-barrel domain
MPLTTKDLRGYSVYATDGNVGGVSDLYFDDESWAIRYLVVKAGGRISNRKVLVSPDFVSEVDGDVMVLRVKLSREQVENGPGIEADRPVAAQQEADYYAYYGAMPYWGGSGPAPELTGAPYTNAYPAGPGAGRGDPHLRSAREVEGYRIRSMDGEIGHVEDFIVDDEAWAIRYVAVDIRNWLPGKKVLVAPRWISGIYWVDAEVSVDLGSIELKEAPAWDPDIPIDREYEIKLHNHYGRPPYWIYDR